MFSVRKTFVACSSRRARSIRLACVVAGVTLAGVATVAPGQEPTTAPGLVEVPPKVVLRTYDVSDLIRATRDYPSQNVYGGGTRGGSEEQKTSGSGGGMSIEFLQQLITDTVEPGSWKVNGGLEGAIQTLPSALIVSHTPDAQKAIDEMLQQLRNQQGTRTMVSVRASWLLLDAADVQAIYDRARKNRPTDAMAGEATMGPAVVDEATMGKAAAYARGQNTCFNGQTVSIVSGRQWQIVTQVTPVVGTGAVGYQAQMDTATSGATLQFTPRLVPGGGAIVDLRSDVNETRGQPADGPIDPIALGTGAATRPTIDRQDSVRQAIATTVRLPLGKPVLIAGMTLEPTSAARPDARQLYLVLEVDAVR